MIATIPFYKHVHSPFYLFNNIEEDVSSISKDRDEDVTVNFQHQLKESEKAFFINVDLPGVKAEAISIIAEKGILKISAQRRTPFGEDFSEQKFSRSFTLPDNVDTDKLAAHYEDGVLFLALPKTAQAQPQKISVSTGHRPSSWQNLIDGADSNVKHGK